MLTMAVIKGRCGPMASGMSDTRECAMASTILVPDKMPVKMPAANTMETTFKAFPACAEIRFSLLFYVWIVHHQGDSKCDHKKNRKRKQAGDQSGHQHDSQRQVKPLESGAFERRCIRIGRVLVFN